MKRIIAISALVLYMTSLGFSEERKIAFRLFNDFVAKDKEESEREKVIGGIVMLVTGMVLAGGSAAAWFWSDEIAKDSIHTDTWNESSKIALTATLAASGSLLVLGGGAVLALPARDLSKEYSYVFTEQDPAIQEALAISSIKKLSQIGKNNRVTGAITGFISPIINIGANIAGNYAIGNAWYSGTSDSLFRGLAWGLPSFAMFFVKSEEELLWDQYETARAALYGNPELPVQAEQKKD